MSRNTLGWTERMVIITIADNLQDPTTGARSRTDELYVGYWLQRHGFSEIDKTEVDEACARLRDAGLIRRIDDADGATSWELTEVGTDEVRRLWNLFDLAPARPAPTT